MSILIIFKYALSARVSQKFSSCDSCRKDKKHYHENANNKRDMYRIYARELIDLGMTFDFDLQFYQKPIVAGLSLGLDLQL